jgi:Kef-type K+ transport system membrane component KefB
LTASFFLGIAVAAISRHGRELRAMVGPTERPVLLPALVLAGAHIDLQANSKLALLAGAAIGARVLAKLVFGWLLALASKPARKAGGLVGLSFASAGALAITIGLAFALRFPGWIGDTVLAIAAVSATFGEFVGPLSLRRSLRAAGEVEGAPASGGAPA